MRYCELFALVLCIRFTPTQECTTPNGVLSECKLFHDCAPLISYLRSRPLEIRSESEKHYIRNLGCPTDNMDKLYVCCASDDQFYQLHLKNTSTTTHAPTTLAAFITTPEATLTSEFDNDLDFPDPSKFECGIDILKNRILGGPETELGEYPWMALLEYENKNTKRRSIICGGSLIHRRYVLTAAHCIVGNYIPDLGRLVNVRLGEHNTSATIDCQTVDNETDCADAVVNVGIEYAQAHPRYTITNSSMDNDIGIIRLARDIEMTKYIQPICFPPSDIDSPHGMELTVSGWGKTRRKEASDVKLHVQVPIVNYTSCQSVLHNIALDNEKQICAGGVFGKDSCNGDSGGPLMKLKHGLWYLEGIVSFGVTVNCGDYGIPGIYTRVNAYRDWVLDYIQYMHKL